MISSSELQCRRLVAHPFYHDSPIPNMASPIPNMAPPQYSYPPVPSSPYSFRHHGHPQPQRIEKVRRLEDKIPEQLAVVKKSDSPYDEASAYVKGFKKSVGSPSSYEKPMSIQISRGDWSKLSQELKISDTDERSRISFYDP